MRWKWLVVTVAVVTASGCTVQPGRSRRVPIVQSSVQPITALVVRPDASCRAQPLGSQVCYQVESALDKTFFNTVGLSPTGPAIVSMDGSVRAVGRAQFGPSGQGQQSVTTLVRQILDRAGWRLRRTDKGAMTFDGAKAFPGSTAVVRPGGNGTVHLVVIGPQAVKIRVPK